MSAEAELAGAVDAAVDPVVEMEEYQDTDELLNPQQLETNNHTGLEELGEHSGDDETPSNNNHESDAGEDSEKPLWFRAVESTFQNPTGKYYVASLWLVIFALALVFSWQLLSHTQFSVHSPRSSKSGKARHKINVDFEDRTQRYYAMFYWTCAEQQCYNAETGEKTDITDESLYLSNMTDYLRLKLENYNESNSEHQIYNISDYYDSLRVCEDYTDDDELEERELCYEGTYDFYIAGENNQSAIMIVQSKKSSTDLQKLDLADYMEKQANRLNDHWQSQTRIKCEATGNLILWVDMQEETKNSVDRNIYFTPLMFALVAYVVHSPRLMLLSIVAVFVSWLVTFLLIFPFTYVMDISTMQPPIYTALVVALALDYSIFLMTRFHDELEASMAIIEEERESISAVTDNVDDDTDEENQSVRMKKIKYETVLKCVLSSVRWSGSVIRVSGFILFLSFVIFLFSTMDFLRSFGLGCAICVVIDAAVALTLLPALVLIWPEFFCVWGFLGWREVEYPTEEDPFESIDSDDDENENEEEEKDETVGNTETGPIVTSDAVIHEKEETDGAINDEEAGHHHSEETPLMSGYTGDTAGNGQSNNGKFVKESVTAGMEGLSEVDRRSYDSLLTTDQIRRYNEGLYTDEELEELLKGVSKSEVSWLQFTSMITEYPTNLWVIGLVYLLILPISILVFHLNIEYGENLIFPRDSHGYEIWKQKVRRDYSAGLVSPFRILIKTNDELYGQNTSVWDWTYMNDTSRMMNELYNRVESTDAKLDSIEGVSVAGDEYFYTLGEQAYEQRIYTSELYHAEVDELVGESIKSSLFELSSHKDPTASHMRDIVSDLRSNMRKVCDRFGYQCFLHGNTVEFSDTVTVVYQNYPYLLTSTVIVVLGYAAWTYGSAFLAFRLSITLVLPLAFIWGIFVLVYRYGMLDWLQWASLHSCGGAMWLTPVMANSVLLGLSLDYECFLYARVHEYMTVLGMPLRTAVINAVMKTGDTITHAGILMCMSFFGLFFGTNKGVNQMGFLIVVGVLVDTFIIRTILVPAILSVKFRQLAMDLGMLKDTQPVLSSSLKD